MAQAPPGNVVTHWHKLIENFHTSPSEFYAAVGVALDKRQIPGIRTSTVLWSEGGVFSPNRTYLRVSGERHTFDMCAAPFGTGFFFSSWVTKRKARLVLLQLLFFAGFNVMIWWALQHGLAGLLRSSDDFSLFFLPFRLMSTPFVLIPVSSLMVLWLIALLARGGSYEPEAAILTVPGIGWIYARWFTPETYYRIDTMLMFQSAVHAAMLEAIDGTMTVKGVRGLAEDDRKPIFQSLM